MRTSYNIYSSFGFIGFCVIYHSDKTIQANLLLFETFSSGNISDGEQPDGGKNFPLKTSDLDILKNLMSAAVPSLGKNGMKYIAQSAKAILNIE